MLFYWLTQIYISDSLSMYLSLKGELKILVLMNHKPQLMLCKVFLSANPVFLHFDKSLETSSSESWNLFISLCTKKKKIIYSFLLLCPTH